MTTATQASAIPTGTFRLDPVHSTVGFEVKHMISTFRGSFRSYDARLVSGDVRDENLAAHLRSPEFFDVENTPTIEFASNELEAADDGSLSVDGEITIRGVTKPIHAEGRVEHVGADVTGSERMGIELRTTVDRREFGLEWNAPLPKGGFALGNDVTLLVRLELVPEEA